MGNALSGELGTTAIANVGNDSRGSGGRARDLCREDALPRFRNRFTGGGRSIGGAGGGSVLLRAVDHGADGLQRTRGIDFSGFERVVGAGKVVVRKGRGDLDTIDRLFRGEISYAEHTAGFVLRFGSSFQETRWPSALFNPRSLLTCASNCFSASESDLEMTAEMPAA